MRYSGLMPSERPVILPPSLTSTSNQHKRIHKQLVFKIGETIHSGPTLVSPVPHKDEDLTITTTTTTTATTTTTTNNNKCVFPANQHTTTPSSSLDSTDLAQIPSTVPSSPQSSQSYYLGTQGSLPNTVPTKSHKALINKGLPTIPETGELSDTSVPTKIRKKAPLKKKLPWDGGLALHRRESVAVPDSVWRRPKKGRSRKSAVISHNSVSVDRTSRDQPPIRLKDIHLMIKKEPDDTSLPDTALYAEEKEPLICSIEPELSRVKSETSLMPEIYEAKYPELNKGRLLIRVQRTPINVTNSGSNLSPQTKENKEMVRLIQEPDTKLDSLSHTRSSRASKRINSSDFGVIEIKPEPIVSRLRRCTRTRKCSCRSDKSESETSDSRSVADENLYFDMVDKGSAKLKPKNGEALIEETAPPHVTAKYNGDVSELQNGAHKLKGRRVSRANSDESDSNSGTKTNGNLEQNGEKIDFSILLEMSPADRKNFENKKAKIRRKTADWQLISETERYYNEKEEIMRNKNKNDSDSDSEDSDCTENNDSGSESSNESERSTTACPSNKNKAEKGKPECEEETRPGVKRQKEELCLQKKRSRPIGSRTRKTLYDLTMLNDDDDDDDDENFFGFPVSTTIPQGAQTVCTLSSSSSSSASQTRSKTKENSSKQYDMSSNNTKVGRKRLSDAERFLRDNREYYHFQETTERLRRSTSSSSDKEKVTGKGEGGSCEGKEDSKKDESKLKDPAPPPPPAAPPEAKKRTTPVSLDGRRVTRSAGVILEPEYLHKPRSRCGGKSAANKDAKRRACEGGKRKCCDDDDDDSKRKSATSESARRISSDGDSKSEDKESENRTSDSAECSSSSTRTRVPESESCSGNKSECCAADSSSSSKGGNVSSRVKSDVSMSELDELYFSFEGVPKQESWYQTYQRLIDGAANNEFVYQEEPLKFVLPYEMPKEYVRDFLCYKKGLLAKKKNDLAELVRKSPRCHASTLALFSDILPSKRAKNAKVLRSAPPAKVEEQTSSDGTSTPGADSTKLPPGESFETMEELAILAMHIDHVMKSDGCGEVPHTNATRHDDTKETSDADCKKTPPKKRGKKRRVIAAADKQHTQDHLPKEFKLFDSSLAQEVDPVFIASLCDDVKDFLIPENILAREATEVVEDSSFCVCTDRASCDELSSADDNTEASSECVSLCDSETIECSVVNEPKRGRSAKKRRKNLTGWPKAQKRKKVVQCHMSDDNDSALGWDDVEPKKHGSAWRSKHHHHHHHHHRDFTNLLGQTTSERLAALAACDRRASPRKKSSVLYMDTWPVRYRSQK